MNGLNPTKAITMVIVAVSAVSMIASVFRKDGRAGPQWSRQATVLAGVFLLIWCAITVLLQMRSPLIPARLEASAILIKTTIGGMGIGIMMTLFMSGSLKWSRSQKNGGP